LAFFLDIRRQSTNTAIRFAARKIDPVTIAAMTPWLKAVDLGVEVEVEVAERLLTTDEVLDGMLNIVLSATSGVKGREVLSRRIGNTVANVENDEAPSAKFWACATLSTRLNRMKTIFIVNQNIKRAKVWDKKF
jgi:hypothetical protein